MEYSVCVKAAQQMAVDERVQFQGEKNVAALQKSKSKIQMTECLQHGSKSSSSSNACTRHVGSDPGRRQTAQRRQAMEPRLARARTADVPPGENAWSCGC